MAGRWFEEMEPGVRIHHPDRVTVTQADNEAFCRLTRNTQPLHLDRDAARQAGFDDTLVNGLYTFALAVGMSVAQTTEGTLVANVAYEGIEHPVPVHPGDVLGLESVVVAARPSSRPGRGVVTLEHQLRNQRGDVVCRFRRVVLVRCRPA